MRWIRNRCRGGRGDLDQLSEDRVEMQGWESNSGINGAEMRVLAVGKVGEMDMNVDGGGRGSVEEVGW